MGDGVKWYTRASVDIFFPEGKVQCCMCPLLETYSRNQCRRTGEYLADTRGIGFLCPLNFEEDDVENIQNAPGGRN